LPFAAGFANVVAAFGLADARVAARAAAAVFWVDDAAAFGAALAAGFFEAVAVLLLPFGIAAAASEISTFLAPRFGVAAAALPPAAIGFAAALAALRPATFAAGVFLVVLANLSSLVMQCRA
jgi:hypothetical protein